MANHDSIEQKILDYFRSRPDTEEVMPPVTNHITHIRDMVWRKRLDDEVLKDLHVLFEFDDEMHKTGLFYLETQKKIKDPPSEGLLLNPDGNYIAYVSTQENILYLLPLPELRAWVYERRQYLMIKEMSSNKNPEDVFYKRVGYCVPRTVLKKMFGKVEEVQLPV